MLNIGEVIVQLRERIQAIDEAINSLKKIDVFSAPKKPGNKRGRKSMGEEERRNVSYRMTAYWAKQKKEEGRPEGEASPEKESRTRRSD